MSIPKTIHLIFFHHGDDLRCLTGGWFESGAWAGFVRGGLCGLYLVIAIPFLYAFIVSYSTAFSAIKKRPRRDVF